MPFSQATVLCPGRHLIRFDAIEAELTTTKDRQALLGNRSFPAPVSSDRLDRMLGAEDGKPGLLSLDVFRHASAARRVQRGAALRCEIGARMAQIAGRGTQAIDALVAPSPRARRPAIARAPVSMAAAKARSARSTKPAARILGLPANDGARLHRGGDRLRSKARFSQHASRFLYKGNIRHAAGKTVLISDMYMHADQIAELLARAGRAPRSL